MKKYGVLIVVSLAMFILTLDTTMMNVAITAIAQDLDTEIQNIQLAVSLYALIMAAFMITGAKLADMYGTKRIFLIGTVMYGVGTLIAALSQNIGMLIAGWSIIEGAGRCFDDAGHSDISYGQLQRQGTNDCLCSFHGGCGGRRCYWSHCRGRIHNICQLALGVCLRVCHCGDRSCLFIPAYQPKETGEAQT